MTVFRLKHAAFVRFLSCEAGIIKCSFAVALETGDEIKVMSADEPSSPPVFAKIRGKHYERHEGKLIHCYVVE